MNQTHLENFLNIYTDSLLKMTKSRPLRLYILLKIPKMSDLPHNGMYDLISCLSRWLLNLVIPQIPTVC